MKYFGSIFKFEWKKVTERRKLWFIAVFTLICLYFVQIGANQYYTILKNNSEVANQEKRDAKTHKSYDMYGAFGINLCLTPPPTSVIFGNDGLFKELSGFVNCLDALDIQIHMKGKDSLQEKQWSFASFSGWLGFLANLMILFFGASTFRPSGFFKAMVSLVGHKRTFLYTVLAKLMIVAIMSIIIWFFAVLLAIANGISFSIIEYWHIAVSYFIWLETSFFFFASGLLVGLVLPKIRAGVVNLILWVILVFLLPMLIGQYSAHSSNTIPSNISTEIKKWRMFVDFEVKAKEDLNEFTVDRRFENKVREYVEQNLKNVFKRVEEIDFAVKEKMDEIIKKQKKFMMFLPSAFFSSVSNEVSGKGLTSISNFHKYMIEFQIGFYNFYLDKKYYSQDYVKKDKPIESFVKNGENIYKSNSQLPGFIWLGSLMSILYFLFFTSLSYKNFLVLMYGIKFSDHEKWLDFKCQINNSDYRVLKFSHSKAVDLFYTIFSGQYSRVPSGLVSADFEIYGEKIDPDNIDFNGKFFYICTPDDLPGDVTVRDLIKLFSTLMDLNADDSRKLYELAADSGSTSRMLRRLKKSEKCSLLLDISSFNNRELLFYSDLTNNTPLHIKGRFLSTIKKNAANRKAVFGLREDLNLIKNTAEDVIIIIEYKKWDELLEAELNANDIVVKQED